MERIIVVVVGWLTKLEEFSWFGGCGGLRGALNNSQQEAKRLLGFTAVSLSLSVSACDRL